MLTKPPPLPPRPPKPGDLMPKPSIVTARNPWTDHYAIPMAAPAQPAWREILERQGLPRDVLVLDFETYFDEDYHMGGDGKSLSTIEYIMDPRFEIMALARLDVVQPFPEYEHDVFCAIGAEAVARELRYWQERYGSDLERCTVMAQNAAFDATILSRHFDIHPPHLIDLLGLARHWNARAKNDLGSLTKRHGLPAKGDTSKFKGVTLRSRYFKPKRGPKMPQQRPWATDQQLADLAAYAGNDVMREWELFTLLLPKLSNPGVELRLMQHTLELFTKPSIAVDMEKGAEIAVGMNAEIESALAKVRITEYTSADTPITRAATRSEISGTKSFERLLLSALEAAGDDPKKYYKPGKKGNLLAIAKQDDERMILLKHADESVRLLMEARVALKSWPLHIARVERIMRQAKANGGLIPVPLKYHGAHTGRYAGGEKINLQNLPVR